MLTISVDAINLIITEEDSDETYYARFESGFSWPGGASGPTVGVGFDCGYCGVAEIQEGWDGIISQDQIDILKKASGIRGQVAAGFVAHYRRMVNIPWQTALQQFVAREVPKWITRTTDVLPNCDQLHPDSLGALVSVAYNRGPSFRAAGDRYTEMRAIYQHMCDRAFALIPQEFMHMRRLWPQGGDLWRRREHEATMFQAGLDAQKAASMPVEAAPASPNV